MIDPAYFWVNVFFLAVGTLVIRFSIIAISNRIVLTDRHRELFTFIPAAILPALLLPMVYFHQGHVAWIFGKERLFILVLSVGVSFFTRNMILTVGFGLISLYLISNM